MLDPSALDSEVSRLRQRLFSTEDALRNALEHNQQVDQLVQAMRRHPDKSPVRSQGNVNRFNLEKHEDYFGVRPLGKKLKDERQKKINEEISLTIQLNHVQNWATLTICDCVFQVHGANSANGIHHQESESPRDVGILSLYFKPLWVWW